MQPILECTKPTRSIAPKETSTNSKWRQHHCCCDMSFTASTSFHRLNSRLSFSTFCPFLRSLQTEILLRALNCRNPSLDTCRHTMLIQSAVIHPVGWLFLHADWLLFFERTWAYFSEDFALFAAQPEVLSSIQYPWTSPNFSLVSITFTPLIILCTTFVQTSSTQMSNFFQYVATARTRFSTGVYYIRILSFLSSACCLRN